MQTLIRRGHFDAGHRVMNHAFKCSNLHGHTYVYELEYAFRHVEDIGYALDFGEVKRVACAWIEDHLDHACIVNPLDHQVIAACIGTNSKTYYMNLGLGCNPTAENIAKEIFFACDYLVADGNLYLRRVRLWETPNCSVVVEQGAMTESERTSLINALAPSLRAYKQAKGQVSYDSRKG